MRIIMRLADIIGRVRFVTKDAIFQSTKVCHTNQCRILPLILIFLLSQSLILTGCGKTDVKGGHSLAGVRVQDIAVARDQSSAVFYVTLSFKPEQTVNVSFGDPNAVVTTSSLKTNKSSTKNHTLSFVPSHVTFTPSNWNIPQGISIRGTAGDISRDINVYNTYINAVTSGDSNFNGLDKSKIQLPSLTIVPLADILISSPLSGTTTESGGEATISYVLNSRPYANVSITATVSDSTEGRISLSPRNTSATMTFTPLNWNIPQGFTITGVDDTEWDGDITYSVNFTVVSADPTFGSVTMEPISVTNLENETGTAPLDPGLTLSSTNVSTNENGTTATVTVVLNTQPTSNVLIPFVSTNNIEGTIDPTVLTFTSANWAIAQTVTIYPVNDDVADGDQTFFITVGPISSLDSDYNDQNPPDIKVTNIDDETVGITASTPSNNPTETGGTATFNIQLNSKPSDDVSFTISSSDVGEATVSPTNFTFTTDNWNNPQVITVTGVDDPFADGNQTINVVFSSCVSADAQYNGFVPSAISLTVVDDEIAGVTPSAITGSPTEAGGTATFTLALNARPQSDAQFTLSSSDTSEGTVSPSSMTFTTVNWATPQTVTVTGVDDLVDDNNQTFSIVLSAITSADAGYNGLDPDDITLTNTDNDTAAVNVSAPSGNTSELGASATIDFTLATQPTANVNLSLSISDTTEGIIDVSSMTFTPSNWNTPQTATITGQDDYSVDGNVNYSVIVLPPTTTDAKYAALNPDDAVLINLDNDVASVNVSSVNGSINESNSTQATFTLRLSAIPTSDVTIPISSLDTTEAIPSVTQVVFNSTNWNTPQTVTVSGVDDNLDDGNQSVTIDLGTTSSTDSNFNGLDPLNITLANIDNDASGFTIGQLSTDTTEAGGTATFTVTLNAEPTADVNLGLSSSDTTEATVSPASFVFTSANWNIAQSATVTGQDDQIDDGDISYKIVTATATSTDSNYNGLDPIDLTGTNIDNDNAGITVSTISSTVSESGTTATFTMVLDTEPTANVTIDLSSSDTTEGTISPTSLTFTPANWSSAQTATVTGVNDFSVDGPINFQILTSGAVSTDSVYNGINPNNVDVTNTDDDTAAINVSAVSGNTTEANSGQATFTLTLNSMPSANVVIGISSNDTTEGTVLPSSITFMPSNWNSAQTVTITGQDDNVDDGDISYSIITAAATSTDPNYSGINASDITLTNIDNDTAGFSISAISGNTAETATTATFTVVLDSEPTANVTTDISSLDSTEASVSPSSLVFTPSNWNSTQTVTVTGVDDDIIDGTVAYTIALASATSTDSVYNGINPSDVSGNNTDNDVAGVTVSALSASTVTEAGSTATFTIALDASPFNNVTVPIASSDTTEIVVSPASLTFTSANWNSAQTVTVTGQDDNLDDGDQVSTILVNTTTSSDANFSGLNPADLTITTSDDDTAEIIVGSASGDTTEAGGTATFTIKLATEPTANVVIGLSSSDATEGSVSPASVTFTAANWNTNQTITATGVDDQLDDGNQTYYIITAAATSTDGNYSGLNAGDVAFINTDNDSAGITVSSISGNTAEDGTTATFTVVLDTEPTADVSFSLSSNDTTEGTVSPSNLTFTSGNWNTAQTVTVTGVNDFSVDGNITYTINLSTATSSDSNYNGQDPADVTVVNNDNDTANINVSAISGNTTEAAGTATFTVVLNSKPDNNVSIEVSSNDLTEGTVDQSTLIFTPTNWNTNQTVTITGVDDQVDDGNITYSIVLGLATSSDTNYSGINPNDVSVTNTDNDTAGVTVSSLSGTVNEDGSSGTFSIVLTSEPTANVIIALSSADSTEASVSPSSLTFTAANWNTAQNVTVTGVDDVIIDGGVGFTIVVGPVTSSDSNYSGIDPTDVTGTNQDNDTASVILTTISGDTRETGEQATFTMKLTAQPTNDVTFNLSSSDTGEGTVSPTSLTYTNTNWNTPQTVTITGVNDAIADGNQTYTIIIAAATSSDTNFNGLDPADVTVINLDDDTPGINVSSISANTAEPSTTSTFFVSLNSQPTADVTIGVSSSDTTEGSLGITQLLFTTANWNLSQTVTVTGVNDDLDDGDIAYTILLAVATSGDSNYNGLDPNDVSVTNTDDDTAGFNVSALSSSQINEASTTQSTFTVALTSEPTANVSFNLTSTDTSEGTVSPASMTFTAVNWSTPQTVTITAVDDPDDDGDIAFNIDLAAATSTDGNYNTLDPGIVSITTIDDDTSGVTVSGISGSTTEAGGTATFTVVLNSRPSANVIIGLTSSDTTEGTISPSSLTFTNTNWNSAQTITLTGQDDNVVDGNIIYTAVTAAATSTDTLYNGINPSDVTVTNTDDDTVGINLGAISGNTTEAGATATFTIVLNSEPTANVTVPLSSSDSTEGTLSASSVTFTPANWNTTQTLTVTGIDDFVDDGDISYNLITAGAISTDPNYNGVNASDLSTTNIDNDTFGVTTSAITGTISEGGGTGTFTVVLDSQPTANVVISLSSSDATEATVSPSSLTFTPSNWNSTQTVTITGVDDNLVDGNQVISIVLGSITSTDTSGYNGHDPADVSVTNNDNDVANATISAISGNTNESGTTATFTIVLTAQPLADVSFALSSSDTTEGTISPSSVTFTSANWNSTQTVTLTGVDDNVDDGDISYNAVIAASTSTDGTFVGIDPTDVSLNNIDDDTAGFTIGALSPSNQILEAGTTQATFTLVLNSEPTANVTVGLSSSDTTEGTVSPASLTFTSANWSTAQTITITAVDDFEDDGNITYSINLAAATSTDGNYNGQAPGSVSLTTVDNDVSGVTVSAISGNTTEGLGTATFTMVLDSKPSADVVIGLTSSDTTEGTISPASLTFTAVNWNVAQSVTLTGVNDNVVDGDITYTAITAAATSADGLYNGINPSDVTVVNTDDDTVGINLSAISGNTSETGTTATFTIVLNSEPVANVQVPLSSSDSTEGTVAPTSLTFTAANWNTPQTVTATGINDNLDDGDQNYSIITASAISSDPNYNGLNASDQPIVNIDDDTRGVTASALTGTVSEGSPPGSATFTLVLDTLPTANVTIPLSVSDTGEISVSPSSITFTPSNWNNTQTITVTGVDDNIIDGNQTVSVILGAITSSDTTGYSGFDPSDVSVTNNDDDVASAIISSISGNTSESPATATFTMYISAIPSADVTFALSSSDTTEGTVSPNSLVFTSANWNTPQTVTVTGVDDFMVDGNITYSIVIAAATSLDGNFNGYDPTDVSVINEDNDVASILISNISGNTSEPNLTANFTVALSSQPTANVTLGLVSDDTTEGTLSTSSLTFTSANWSSPQQVIITGQNDDVDDGDISYNIITNASVSTDGNYNGLNPSDINLLNIDDDTAGFTVGAISGQVTEGGTSASFNVNLDSEPTANVVIAVTSSDTSEGTVNVSSLTFTSANWSTTQSITVTGQDDNIDDGDISYTIDLAAATSTDSIYNGLDPANVTATTIDDDTFGVNLTAISGDTSEFGASATFTVALATEPTADVTIPITSSDTTEGTVSPSSLIFTSANYSTPQTITVTGIDDGIQDGDVTYQVLLGSITSTDTVYNTYNPSDVTVVNLDNDSTGITVGTVSGSTTENGGTATFTVVLDSTPSADVTIPLSSSDTTEGTVSPSQLIFTNLNWSTPQTVTATGVDDTIADGPQTYQILLNAITSTDPGYGGFNPADVTITNGDDDSAAGFTVSSISSNVTEEANQATFTIVLNTLPTADVVIGISSSDTTEATVSPSSLTFTTVNWAAPQQVTVTGVDDGIIDGNQSIFINTAAATSSDSNYNGLDPSNVSLLNIDNDSTGFLVSSVSGQTSELGATATFTVSLLSPPTANVTLNLASNDTSEAITDKAQLVYTTVNWSSPQQVLITGQDDDLEDGNQPYTIVFSPAVSTDSNYSGFSVPNITGLTNTDDDSFRVSISYTSLQTTEDQTSIDLSFVLTSPPAANVSFSLNSSDTTEGTLSTNSLTFTPVDWSSPKTVTVSGVDDASQDGNQVYTITTSSTTSADPNYNALAVDDLVLTNADNDSPGITVSPTAGQSTTESGDDIIFSVYLNSSPTADVTINLSSSDTTEGTVTPATLIFNNVNWAAAQSVTVRGVDDALADGNQVYTINIPPASSTDPVYNNLDPTDVTVTNLDDESPGFTILPATSFLEPIDITEQGGQQSITVFLNSAPSAEVTLNISSSNTAEGVLSQSSIVFTTDNWNASQVFTITGVDDTLADGHVKVNVVTDPAISTDPKYSGLNPTDVYLRNLDDDQAGITTSELPVVARKLTTNESGDTAQFSVVLNIQPSADVTIPIYSDDETEGITSVSQLIFTTSNWNIAQVVTVTGQDDTLQDGAKTFRAKIDPIVSADPNYNGINPSDIDYTNYDNDTAGILVEPYTSIVDTINVSEYGQQGTFSVVLLTAPTANVTIPLTNPDTTEIVLDQSQLVFTTSNWDAPQTVTITGLDDALNDGNRRIRIRTENAVSTDLDYNDLNANDIHIQNIDND